MADINCDDYCEVVELAIADAKANKLHCETSYCGVADFCQNMEFPFFKEEQAGPTYYLSPPTVNCFGVVNHAHKYPNGEIKAHLHAHVYHEGVRKREPTMWRPY